MVEETKFPSQLAERFQVRMPDGLRDRIAEAAKANNRSMNAEIVAALTEKFPEPHDAELEEMIERARRYAPGELERLVRGLLAKDIAAGNITEQDIEDGLVPGFTVRRVPAAD